MFSGRLDRHSDANFHQSKAQTSHFCVRTVPSEQRYWRDSIRKTLFQNSFWFTNTNGLLTQFLHKNSACFKSVKDPSSSQQKLKAPLNLSLTLNSLTLLSSMFDLPDKLSKYAITEEIKVFFIRTHHINFVRLYNKHRKYIQKIQDHSELQQTARIQTKRLMDNRKHKMELNKANSNELSKHHLKCLFAIAKNRTQETREKMF